MKGMSKWLVLLIAMAMLTSLVAVACSPSEDEPDETTTAPAGDDDDVDPVDDDDEDEDVDVDLEFYELTWFMLTNSTSGDVEMIEEKLNEIIEPLINANVDIQMLDWGTWDERYPTAMNAGETVDLSFVADWWNHLDYVANNFLTPLNDLMAEHAPQVIEQLGEGFILGSQIDGVNYGVPTDKEFAVNEGYVWNQSIADDLGFDMDELVANVDIQNDRMDRVLPMFEDMLAEVSENSDVIPYLMDEGGWIRPAFTEFVTGFGVRYDDLNDTTVQYTWEEEERLAISRLHQDYYAAGYIDREAYTENNRADDHLLEGNFFLCSQPLKPFKGKSLELMTAGGGRYELDEVEVTPYVGVSLHAAGSMMAIPTTSQDPDRAMMFINLMHTNKDVANTLVWGIEDLHHEVVDEAADPKLVKTIPDNTWTAAVLPWTLGNVFNHWMGEHEDSNKHAGFRITKEEADSHVTLGFRFTDIHEYQAEMAAIDNAASEYAPMLATGAVDDFDDTHASLISAVEAAGMREVQDAIQTALDDWMVEVAE